MNKTVWKIDAAVLQGGHSLLIFRGEGERFPGLNPLKRSLFGWHEDSYYGTMIEEWTDRGDYGFVIPARQAVGYWSEPPVLGHGPAIAWDEGARQEMRTARLIRKVLAEGWFVPAKLEDLFGWRLLRVDETHPDPEFASECEHFGLEVLDRRLTEILLDFITYHKPVTTAWQKVAAAFPVSEKLIEGAGAGDGGDEETFWEAIGFRTEAEPFAVGLLLMEPDTYEGEWRLKPWIYERAAPDNGEVFEWQGQPLNANTDASTILRLSEKPVIAAAIRRKRERWSNWIGDLTNDWGLERVWQFLELESEMVLSRGVRVLLPGWWEELRKARPSMVAKLRSDAGASGLLGKDQLLAFDWMIAVGGGELDIAAFRDAVQNNRKLVWNKGKWLVLHPKWIRQLQTFLQKMGKRDHLTLSEAVESYLSGGHSFKADSGSEETDGRESELLWHVGLNAPVSEWLAALENKESRQADAKLPDLFRKVLRNYQAAGASWLLSLRRIGFGACLADDMGLGKTVQFLAYLAALKERGEIGKPGLLVCPTSVLGNWQKETERFAPELIVHLHYGPRREQENEGFDRQIEAADLVITSYALANTDSELLRRHRWSVICLDEAQNIKNPNSKQSKAVRSFPAEHRIALTGTPVENRLSELWTIFDFMNPAYLGTLAGFQRKFGLLDKPAADEEGSRRRDEATTKLGRMIRPFLMRRLKSDPSVQLDLPEKNESLIYVPLTMAQGALYEAELRQMLDKIEKLDAMERRGVILAAIGKLKQICDHPALVRTDETRSVKKQAARESTSHKLSRLVEMAGEAREEGRKGIIFTQFVEMGEILRKELEEALDCKVDFLHGGVTKEVRDKMVARFQEAGGGTDFLVLSLRAGGSGLNLTAATHVFHYDRWWNPAVEEQATDRAYRIGQTRDVQVHKFVALGTVEERIDEMISRKKSLSDRIVGSGEQWVTELTTDELRDMFALRREWVRD